MLKTLYNRKATCLQSFYTEMQSMAGGKNSYRVVASFSMTQCRKTQVNHLSIEYDCIPGNILII